MEDSAAAVIASNQPIVIDNVGFRLTAGLRRDQGRLRA